MANLVKLTLLLTTILAVESYVRVCYFTNWAQYRNGVGKYSMSRDYQTGLCTHLIFSFGKVIHDNQGGYHIGQYEWNDETLFREMRSLKTKDRNLKMLLAIGGWTHSSNGFKEMVHSYGSRRYFIEKSILYLKKYGFDGLDLDWEYPGERGSEPSDRQKFTKLCQELSAAYKPHRLLVTAAVKAAVAATKISYEVKEISEALDFVNLMTYDMYGAWKKTTGHNSNTDPAARPHNVHLTVETWIAKGANPKKLVLGLASYGRTFKLGEKCQWELGSRATGAGSAGRFTKSAGFLAYYEICNLKWENHVCTKSSKVHAPYGSVNGDFIGYDDQESIQYKINNVMKKHGMKGYMFWALDLDDFSGKVCGEGRYPLMNAAKNAALGNSAYSIKTCKAVTDSCKPTPQPPTKITQPPTRPVVKGKCKAHGPWKGDTGMDRWCNQGNHCQQACTKPCGNKPICDRCSCDSTGPTTKPKTTKATTKATTKPTTKPTTMRPGPKTNCKSKRGRRYASYCNHYCMYCEKYTILQKWCTCE